VRRVVVGPAEPGHAVGQQFPDPLQAGGGAEQWAGYHPTGADVELPHRVAPRQVVGVAVDGVETWV
jgi:hypothetical protein